MELGGREGGRKKRNAREEKSWFYIVPSNTEFTEDKMVLN
jgi:hypothetical protein